MSDDAKSLQAALLISPDDADLWKVYADCLEETGSESDAAQAREVARLLDNDGTLPSRISALSDSVRQGSPDHKSFCDRLIESEFEQLISDRTYHIIDSEEISGVIAETNAFGFSVDDIEVAEVSADGESWVASFTFSASGEQDEDRFHYGDTIRGAGTITLTPDGKVQFGELSGRVYHGDQDDADEY